MSRGSRTARRLAVVMFTDVVDSTAQRQRLGEHRAEEVRVAVDNLQIDLITTNGGELVKHLGDGLMASFGSASGALMCAIGVQSELRRLATRLPEPVHLRIGIGAGDVADADGDLFGMPVVQAARLCNATDGGGVLVADLVRELTGRDPAFELTDATPMRLKGLDHEVVAWRLLWEHDQPDAGVPSGLERDERFVFVGRTAEWNALSTAWTQAGSGEAQVAVVSGDAGVGKTRLVAELAERVDAEGGLVLYGRNEQELDVPYQPFAEALRQYVGNQPGWALARRLGRSRGELVRLLPELSRIVEEPARPAPAGVETERFRMFDAVVHWLAEASSLAPVLLVIDDLHWASVATHQLLRHVVASHEPLSVLVVATRRHDESSMPNLPLPPHRFHDLRLEPFEPGTVLDFLEAAAGHSLDEIGPPLAATIHRQTGGNAFFCRELALHLVDEGVLAQVDGRWTTTVDVTSIGIPDTIRRVVEDRLERIDELARETLLWVAVIGYEVGVPLMLKIVDAPPDEVRAALGACVDARLLAATGLDHFHFHHALVRSSLVDAIDDERRSAMHRRVADVLLAQRAEGIDVQIGELARHYELGADDDRLDEAVTLAREAGHRAMEQLAYERAVALLGRSPGAPDHERRSDLMVDLVSAAIRAADPRVRELSAQAMEAAAASGDARREARALLASSRGAATASGTVDPDRVRRLQETLDRLPPDDDPDRARLLAVLATELQFTGEVDRVIALGDQALAMARRLGDRATRIFVLVERLGAIRLPDHLDAQLADVVELGRLSRLEGDRQAEFFASYRAADIHLSVNDLAGNRADVENARRLADELGQPAHRVRALRVHQEGAWLRGDLAAAESEQEEFLALARELNQERQYMASYLGCRAKLASAQGRPEIAVECFRSLAALPRGTDGFKAGLAVAMQLAGEIDEARELYEELIAKGVERLSLDITRVHTLCYVASVCASLGDVEQAMAIDEQLRPYADLWVASGANSYGPVQHFLARLLALRGRDGEADAAFADASARCRRMEAPLHEAWNQIAWSQFLLDRGEVGRARELADAAATTGAAHDAGGVERSAFEVMERLDAIAAADR